MGGHKCFKVVSVVSTTKLKQIIFLTTSSKIRLTEHFFGHYR